MLDARTQQTLGLPSASNPNFKSDVSTQEGVQPGERDYQQYMRMSSPQSLMHQGGLKSYKIIPRSTS